MTGRVEVVDAFPHDYEVVVVDELRAADEAAQRFFYPEGSRSGGRDGITVRVTTPSRSWLGTFAFGYGTDDVASCVVTLPDPGRVCVVAQGAGYVVEAEHPEASFQVEAFPIHQVWPIVSEQLVVFADRTTLVAYGPAGKAWTSDRVSWDGLRIVTLDGGRLWGRAWDATTERDVSFAVDVRTGAHAGGAAPEAPSGGG